MKAIFLLLSFSLTSSVVLSLDTIDCDFNGPRKFCRWKLERFGLKKGAWRRGGKVRRTQLVDPHPGGKMAYFRARSRPEGFRSQLRSPVTKLDRNGLCFSMKYAVGGSSLPYPNGLSLLRVFAVSPGESPDLRDPIFAAGDKTGSKFGHFQKAIFPVELLDDPKTSFVQFVVEAVRGGSRKAYVVVDDVKVHACAFSNASPSAPAKLTTSAVSSSELANKKEDIVKDVLRLMLPARRPPTLFTLTPSGPASLAPSSSTVPAYRLTPGRLNANKKRKNNTRKGRKGRKRKNKRRKKGRHRTGVTRVAPTGFLTTPLRPAFLRVTMCDFIEYTQRLQRCFRGFFAPLQKRPKACKALYKDLELCLQTAAQSCIPSRDMTTQRVVEIVTDTLRVNFRTEDVYCREEGAFVFPDYTLSTLPLQCGPRYFLKLAQCSGPFSRIFHLKHGDPKLCKEYYTANECQRQTTAEECNFDADTMLRYGLNLQYQFGHNPFCVHLPFSSWWPVS